MAKPFLGLLLLLELTVSCYAPSPGATPALGATPLLTTTVAFGNGAVTATAAPTITAELATKPPNSSNTATSAATATASPHPSSTAQPTVTLPTVTPGPPIWGDCQESSGMLYIRDNRIWQIGADRRVREVRIPQTFRFLERVDWAPDGKHLAYVGYTALGEEAFVACADGTHPVSVTGTHLQVGIGWVNSKTLLYSMADKTVSYSKLPSDNTTFLRDLTTGQMEELTNLAGTPGNAFVDYSLNPADPDLVSMYKKGDAYYYIANRRTGARTAVIDVPPDGDALGRWSPDGERLAFTLCCFADGSGSNDIYTVNRDGSNLQKLAHFPNGGAYPPAWSPNQEWIAFFVSEGSDIGQLFAMSLADHSMTNLNIKCSGASPVWSPDGSEVACNSNQVKMWQWDIYAVSVKTKAIRQVTNDEDVEEYLSWR